MLFIVFLAPFCNFQFVLLSFIFVLFALSLKITERNQKHNEKHNDKKKSENMGDWSPNQLYAKQSLYHWSTVKWYNIYCLLLQSCGCHIAFNSVALSAEIMRQPKFQQRTFSSEYFARISMVKLVSCNFRTVCILWFLEVAPKFTGSLCSPTLYCVYVFW
jgi:hypothetical protein